MTKRLIAILLAMVLVGVVFAGCKAKPEEEESSTAADTSVSQQEETTATSEEEEETTVAEEDGTATSVNDHIPPFIKEGCWYFFEEEDKMAYACDFDKGGKMTIAYFNRENVEGDDAKFFEGTADYDVKGNTLSISNIPKEVGLKSLELTIVGEQLQYNGIRLEKYDEISLEHAFNHFN